MLVDPSAAQRLPGAGLMGSAAELGEFRRAVRRGVAADAPRFPGVDGDGIQLFLLEPGDYGETWSGHRTAEGFRFSFSFPFSFDGDDAGATSPPDPRGTVILLHGLYGEGMQLLPHAMRFAAAGYRSVLVDLRAHGASGGRYVTFGVKERRDLAAVLDSLRDRTLLAPPVVLYGASLGGAVALQAAATGAEVDRVVALAAYADAREAVTSGADALLPGWLDVLVSERRVRAAADRAEELAGFEFDQASTSALAPRVDVPVLLLHTRGDEVVSFSHAERLHRRLGCSTLRPVEEGGHMSLVMDPEVAVDPVLSWLRTPSECGRRARGRGKGPAPSTTTRSSTGTS
jgi:pimeloyl-ACP methyl ester carboxylesterase